LLVEGDAEELRTAIANLVDNAVKYSGQQVQVSIEVAAPSPDTVWVRVRDRGIGIPRAQLRRIFRRFYRVQGGRAYTVKGTGLGLYIVRSIVRQHGGRVFAASEGEGKGATFTMELPRLVRT
jgi:signal transduction histidine kinase